MLFHLFVLIRQTFVRALVQAFFFSNGLPYFGLHSSAIALSFDTRCLFALLDCKLVEFAGQRTLHMCRCGGYYCSPLALIVWLFIGSLTIAANIVLRSVGFCLNFLSCLQSGDASKPSGGFSFGGKVRLACVCFVCSLSQLDADWRCHFRRCQNRRFFVWRQNGQHTDGDTDNDCIQAHNGRVLVWRRENSHHWLDL